jgi:hypothetical protein
MGTRRLRLGKTENNLKNLGIIQDIFAESADGSMVFRWL